MLTETVALAHPLIPFETEEIYSHIPGAEGLLAARAGAQQAPIDERAEGEIARVIEAVQALRGWRDTAGVKAGAVLDARLAAEGYEQTSEHLARLARLSLSDANGDGSAETVATVPVPGGTVQVLAGGALDLEGAERRLAERRAKLSAEIERAQRKLANQGFVAKAPPAVVGAERDKLAAMQAELEAL